ADIALRPGTDIAPNGDPLIQNSTTQSDTGMDFFSMFSNDCSFYNNNFESGAIFVGSNPLNYRHTMQNNTARGLPLGYFWQETGFDIDASYYGQIILANCSDGILRNGAFDSVTAAVTIAYGWDVTVEDTDFSNCLVAIWVQESVMGGVYNCQFSSNQYCIMSNFTTGFNIVDNIFQTSMFLSLYVIMCDSGVIGENLFEFNEQCIMAMQCSNFEITSNQFFNTSTTAVTLDYYSTGFSIYNNEFGDNGQHAQDDGSANLWDDAVSVGNAWDDYDGSPPYSIPGSAMSVDRFPRFLLPVAAPTIDSPEDIFYVQGSTGHIITWTPSSMIPGLFMVYRNGTLVASAIWNGLPISIDVDGFLSGAYYFTIVVFDTEGRNATDTVWVFVSAPSTATTITTSTTTNGTDIDLIMVMSVAVTIGSALVVILVVITIFRSRRDAIG
ncbi:MAG: NosD domain-containing protein, partial [Promethearchaeota archaeon]